MRVGTHSQEDLRPAAIALVATVLLHVALGTWLSSPLTLALRLPVVPAKVMLARTPVDPSRLPASMRLAETAPQGNREIPAEAPHIASRNQVAAQPVPEKAPTRSALPRSEGESTDTLRLAQARPRSAEQVVDVAPRAEAGTPNVGVQTARAPSATGLQPRPPATPASTPRASLPSGTYGLLLRNPVGVSRAGTLSLDGRFSSYGDYSQRMFEAIQASWWALIERTHFDDFAAGFVVIRFRIHRDGTVSDAEILASTVPPLAALTCKDAILMPAPYDIWRADMVAMLGEDEPVTVTFHYR